ncbi:MAG: LUD domain-containing protein [Verrucomicrobia bacterium]|nr:LUD domain-containing protein [Verrucomicrobiota bacterium]MBI3867769.1 LUD domain-containing protein [Verrucomicrobiota bacterium]
MTERENILGRIREALKTPAPRPGGHAGQDHDSLTASSPARTAAVHAREWLPPVPETAEGQLALFAAHSADLKTDFRTLPDADAFASALRDLAAQLGWKRVASHNGDLTFRATEGLDLPILRVDAGYDVNEMEDCDAGVTECDALVAQTGSVVLTSRSAGGRALSVLPPHHVVLARLSQLVRDLPAAFALLQAKYSYDYPSFMTFITGPSRTGDIERILVLGAHGPKKLTILCADH